VITPGGVVTAAHSGTLYQEARIWFAFTGGMPNTSAPAGTVTIRCQETNQEFMFTLLANTIPLPAGGVGPAPADGDTAPSSAMRTSEAAGVTWTWTWRTV
jgi:hypothetical protein